MRVKTLYIIILLHYFAVFNPSFSCQESQNDILKRIDYANQLIEGGDYKYLEACKALDEINELAKTENDLLVIAKVNYINGQLALLGADYEKGILYYNKSNEIYEELDEISNTLINNKAIAIAYRNLKKYDKIEDLLLKSVAISKNINHFNELQPLQEITVFYSYDKQDYKEALYYGNLFFERLNYYSSKNITDKEFKYIKDDLSKIVSLELGKSYIEIGEYNKAIKYIEDAKVYYEEYDDIEKLRRVYMHLMTLYSNTGQAVKFNHFRSKFQEVDRRYVDFLMTHMKSVYSVKKELLTTENKKDLIELENKKNQELSDKKSLILCLLALGVILTFVFMLSYMFKNKKYKKLNLLLIKSNEDLIDITNDKLKFLSTMSHEIRTPLFAIRGIIGAIGKDKLDEVVLNVLKFSSDKMLFLVNNILNYNSIKDKKVKLEPQVFNLNELCKDLTDSLNIITKEKSFKMHLDIKHFVNTDKRLLNQILYNILDNAINFSRDKISFSVIESTLTQNTSKFTFVITDDGIGIPKDKYKNVFLNFSEDKYIDKEKGGSGIGLYLSKEMLKLFDSSEIVIESEIGEGSSFSFSINLPIENKIVSKISYGLNSIRKKVIIIDDNNINLMIAKKIISSESIDVVCTSDYNFLLKEIKTKRYDLILMDIGMPIIDGYELTKLIRFFDKEIPVLGHTAFIKENVFEKTKIYGFNDVIVKPYTRNELIDKIKKLTSNSSSSKANI